MYITDIIYTSGKIGFTGSNGMHTDVAQRTHVLYLRTVIIII